MKKYLEYIKEIRKDKRKSALASLGIWILFFVLVISCVGKAPKEITIRTDKEEEIITNPLDNFKNMKSYDVSYLVETNVNNYTINSTYHGGNNYYIYDNNNYYLENDILYYVDNINMQLKKFNIDNNSVFGIIDIKLLTKDSLHTIITSSEEESKTSYKDGKVVKNYIYTTSDNRKMYITTTEIDNTINKIVIDYKEYFNTSYAILKVTCDYQNINNILEYDKDYTKYHKVEGE